MIQFKLVDGKVNYVDPPAGLNLDEGLTGWTVINNKVVLSADEKKLLGDEKLRTKDKGDIEVYFISDLRRFTTAQAQTVTTKRKDLLQKPE